MSSAETLAISPPTHFAKTSTFLADTGASVLVSLLTVSFTLSYAALLFGGVADAVQAQGLFVLLIATMILGTAGAAFSTLPFAYVTLESSSMSALAVGAMGMTAALRGTPDDVTAATLLVGLSLTAVVTGVVLLALGVARGGAVVRFVPLQVMAGLVSASAISLITGGATVALGHALSWTAPMNWLHLAVAVAGAAIALATLQVVRSSIVLPALVATGIAGYHITFRWLGISLDQQRADGWLLGSSAHVTPVLPWTPTAMAHVDWSVLLDQSPNLLAVIVVSCVAMMLNASGLEIASRRDVDIDRDLRANGIAAIISGLAGGVLGILNLSRSVLLARLGSGTRRFTVLAALLSGFVPILWPELLALLPRPVLGALLLYVGADIFRNWTIRTRSRLTLLEWLTIPAVVAVALQFGLLTGVFAGLALGCATFAIIYSRGSPIRSRYTGDVARSHVDRPAPDRAVLDERADAVLVLYLQGFLFFGTASRLLQEVKQEVAKAQGHLRHVVFECSNIDGLDGSGRAMFERMAQVAAANDIVLYFAAVPAGLPETLAALPNSGQRLRFFPTLDRALEACEDSLLAGRAAHLSISILEVLATELRDRSDIAALAEVLQPSNVEAGTVLMRQGETSDHLAFIESGQASVTVDYGAGPQRVRSFGAGTMVGEIAFLLGTPRTATVQTDTPCRLWTLTKEAMYALESRHPRAALALQRAVMRRLSLRLLDKDHLIAALMRGARPSD